MYLLYKYFTRSAFRAPAGYFQLRIYNMCLLYVYVYVTSYKKSSNLVTECMTWANGKTPLLCPQFFFGFFLNFLSQYATHGERLCNHALSHKSTIKSRNIKAFLKRFTNFGVTQELIPNQSRGAV